MKKIFFVALILALTIQSFAQSNPVYVVFTSTKNEVQGVWHDIDNNYNTALYRCPPRDYTIMNRQTGYFFRFLYLNRNEKPNKQIISKPESFLNTVPYIDWDVIGPTLTKAQAEAKRDEILSHSPIYFIDRKETANGTIKLVPVGLMKSRY